MRIVVKLLISAAAVWVAVRVVDGLEFDGSWVALLGIALVLGLLNAVVRPILSFFSFPFVLLTLGLFVLVINAVVFAIAIWVSGLLELGLTSTGFGATFLGALVVTAVTWLLELFLRRRD